MGRRLSAPGVWTMAGRARAAGAAGSADRGVTDRAVGLFDRTLVAGGTAHPAAALAGIVALLALCWLLVWFTGGTQRAYPHAFYVPIILAGLPFGLRGAVLTALVAAVAVGPLMPLDAVTGEQQTMQTWITRAVFFVVIGAVVSLALAARERALQHRLSVELGRALAVPTRGTAADPALVPLVDDLLARGAFHVLYQPIYSLGDGALLGVEALTRVDVEPYRPPDHWFAAAQAAGRGDDLEMAAVAAAIAGAEHLPAGIELAINLSPAVLADPRLVELVRSAGGRQLVVEITEHAAIEDYDTLLERLAQLRALGVLVAVDDAGAGIASLRHIVQIAPDIIKLDISLTQEVTASPLRRALGGSLIEFAERTGARLLVEGVEHGDDLVAWTHLGAHAAQGYLLGRPGALPAAPVSSLVALAPVRRQNGHRAG